MSRRAQIAGRVVALVAALGGLSGGVGLYTFVYANGASYLTDNAAACANCHVMQGHYDAWTRSSHHAVATCNDCHTPAAFVGKYLTKGSNGYHHSLAFTTGRFHEPIQITARNLEIVEDSCRRCHADVVQMIDAAAPEQTRLTCVRCHESVGHLH